MHSTDNRLESMLGAKFTQLSPTVRLDILGQLGLPANATVDKAAQRFEELCAIAATARDPKDLATASARLFAIAQAAKAADRGEPAAQQALLELLMGEPSVAAPIAKAPPGLSRPAL